MRRALILIITLSLLCFGAGLTLDRLQVSTAQQYLNRLHGLRMLVEDEAFSDASAGHRSLHAQWLRDEKWMNCLISHHHTRAVSEAMQQLETALRMGWQVESMQAINDALAALEEIHDAHRMSLQNVW